MDSRISSSTISCNLGGSNLEATSEDLFDFSQSLDRFYGEYLSLAYGCGRRLSHSDKRKLLLKHLRANLPSEFYGTIVDSLFSRYISEASLRSQRQRAERNR